MIDKRPALIARCADVADVIAAVNFARDHGLLLAIRGGGHNGAGLGTCDDGLVIDLSPMNGGRVDPGARTARVEGGALAATSTTPPSAFGLATPSGIISTTGVGGITLGGGHRPPDPPVRAGHRQPAGADVVLADGSFVTASGDEHPDLFWAMRGGGGNFGVVTSFLFRLHPMSAPSTPGRCSGRWSGGGGAALVPRLPAAGAATSSTASSPSSPCRRRRPSRRSCMQKMCGVVWCYTGVDAEAAAEAIAPLFGAARPL